MNERIFLLLVLGGVLALAGWRTSVADPSQSSGPIAERARSPSPKDRMEDPDFGRMAKPKPNEIGRVELSEKKIQNANLDIETAGPAKIATTVELTGKIALNEDSVANVSPRYTGVVKAVYKRLGDQVQKGEALATIESSESLREYQVNSEISGIVIKKEVTVGELARDEKPIFTVADLSTVWVDFSVFPQDFLRVKPGQMVEIAYADHLAARGKISYIAPVGSESTQSLLARAVVQNPEGLLRPGLFVTGKLFVEEIDAPVAVLANAIQTVNGKTVVFVADGATFEARQVELGTRDNSYVQVLSGLSAGNRYVAANSFLLKAELGKNQPEELE